MTDSKKGKVVQALLGAPEEGAKMKPPVWRVNVTKYRLVKETLYADYRDFPYEAKDEAFAYAAQRDMLPEVKEYWYKDFPFLTEGDEDA